MKGDEKAPLRIFLVSYPEDRLLVSHVRGVAGGGDLLEHCPAAPGYDQHRCDRALGDIPGRMGHELGSLGL